MNESKKSVMIAASFGIATVLALLAFSVKSRAEELLLRIDSGFAVSKVEARDAKVAVRGQALEVATGHKNEWPGITLHAPRGHWDLSAFETRGDGCDECRPRAGRGRPARGQPRGQRRLPLRDGPRPFAARRAEDIERRDGPENARGTAGKTIWHARVAGRMEREGRYRPGQRR